MIAEPLGDRVLIHVLEGERQIENVILPDSAKEDFRAGIVVAVGEGYISENGDVRPLRLNKGDKVLFGPFAGIPVQIAEQSFLLMREAEIGIRLK